MSASKSFHTEETQRLLELWLGHHNDTYDDLCRIEDNSDGGEISKANYQRIIIGLETQRNVILAAQVHALLAISMRP